MIDELYLERLKLLGLKPPNKLPDECCNDLVCPALREPIAEERRARPAAFMGKSNAFEALPALDLNFARLEQSYLEHRKPALDVGASFSTVALQGTFHSIPIHSTDLRCDKNRHISLLNMRNTLELFRDVYLDPEQLPAGFECFPIEQSQWDECIARGIEQVNARMVQCSADRILLPGGAVAPDQYFSTVLSHHAVPKYSRRDHFLNQELPELLRVTHDRLHLFPLISAGPEEELLHVAHSESRKRLERMAHACGFDLEIKISPSCHGKAERGDVEPGFNMLGVFHRRRSRP